MTTERPRLRHLLLAVSLTACGGAAASDGDVGLSQQPLPDAKGLDVHADAAGGDLDPTFDGASAADAVDAVTPTADGGSDSAADSTTITSCLGRCFLVLTDDGNPCSCNPSCLDEGDCCADFQAMCACAGDADCDDKSACTADACKDGKWCKNIPTGLDCCVTDAECGGGSPCKPVKCSNGACTAVPKVCDDGFACTVDFCDAASGQCDSKAQAGSCMIDGACRKSGDQKPGSGGCLLCDPGKSQTAWTVAPAKCFIDGECVDSGSAKVGQTCLVCNAQASSTAWSPTGGTCAIAGQCFANGAVNPAVACQVCDAVGNPSAWSVAGGGCFIEGICHPNGETSGAGCKVCAGKKVSTAWTINVGKACDDGSVCTATTSCDAAGQCVGPAKASCCLSDADCAATVEPTPCTQPVCNKATGTCGATPLAGCCTEGVCCSAQKVQPAGTVCGAKFDVAYKCEGAVSSKHDLFYGCNGVDANKCSSSTPGYGPWTVDKTCGDGTTCKLQGGQTACVAP